MELHYATTIIIARTLGKRAEELRQKSFTAYSDEKDKILTRWDEACEIVELVYKLVGLTGLEDEYYGEPDCVLLPDEP